MTEKNGKSKTSQTEDTVGSFTPERRLDKVVPLRGSRSEREDWIGDRLREIYDPVLKEPIPQRFLELLRELKKKDPSTE